MRTLSNAVVVVTGASRGIGHAIAEEFGRGGAKVVVNYNHNKEQAEELVQRLLKEGSPAAIAVQANVADPDQAARLIEETIKQFGRIDVLVNNAGINIDRSLRKMSVQDWDTVIRTNLSSYFYTFKAALPYFIEQKSGAIINISTLTAFTGNFGQANYTAAKAGILGFTKTAALELARSNVTVNAICPGPVETDMWAAASEEAKKALLARVPLGRPATAEEIAKGARYLYENGEIITGTTLHINGGMYMS
jgi:acetoacetyl-CoA reductase